jgi:hypothetical protein
MPMSTLARTATIALAAAVFMAWTSVTPTSVAFAAEGKHIKVGVLTCAAGPKLGLLITSKQKINCSFQPNSNEAEHYHGVIREFGLDIGATAASVIIWAVFAQQSDYAPGSLAGTYVGLSAEETVVLGLGANVLVGGSEKSLALQPLSVQGQAGLNLAIGVSRLELVEN